VATTVVLVRHGETDWNREQRFQGRADTPLNDAGRAQARELAVTLAGERFAAAYSSPLRRAFETARIVARTHGLEVRKSPALLEVDVGSWSGLTRAEIEARFPDGYRRWLARDLGWEDGESYHALGRRVVRGLLEIARAHPAEQVLAVTHGGPIRAALLAAQAERVPRIGNCTVVRIAVRGAAIEAVD
jgi:probable phosphoglycerate mutase